MTAMETMPGHTRLYRRGAVYYHRAAVPHDIVETYGKREETFSLRTKDRAEALRRVRIAAVQVDEKFAKHRREVVRNRLLDSQPPLDELTTEQIARVKAAYLHHLLDEDEEVRLDGFYDPEDELLVFEPRPTFKERQDLVAHMDEVKLIYLAIRNFEKGGRNVREWYAARNQFAIMFEERFNA